MLQPYQNMDYEIIKKQLSCRSKSLYEAYPFMKVPAVISAMNRLSSSNYFRCWTTEEQAASLTVPELKELLKSAGQPQQGKKCDLINRVLENIPDYQILYAAGNVQLIRLTEAGEEYYNFLKNTRIREYDELVDNIRNFCLQGDFNAAYHNMCLYEARQFFKRGMGIDWEKHSQRPIPYDEQAAAYQFMIGATNKATAATMIAYYWLGSPGRFRDYMNRHPENDVDQEQLHYGHSLLCTLRELANYRHDDYKKYKIILTDDACDCCKAHENKRYCVSEAQIGVNCPPFHAGCRCRIVAELGTFDDGTPIKAVGHRIKKKLKK